MGVERTFRDKTQDEEILAELESIAEELEKDLKSTQYAGKTVTVKYKVSLFPLIGYTLKWARRGDTETVIRALGRSFSEASRYRLKHLRRGKR